jgi:hypothetical protein
VEIADPIEFPVGYERLHRSRFSDYQLNRARSLGLAAENDLRRGAAEVRRPRDVIDVFDGIAEAAASEQPRSSPAPRPPRSSTPAESTTRTFTKAEHADQNCQMGNLPLACQVVTDWLDTNP